MNNIKYKILVSAGFWCFSFFFNLKAHSQEIELAPLAISKAIERTLRDQKILFIAETHKSSASFDRVGSIFLKVLRPYGFNCLMLESGEGSFQSAYDAFMSGRPYEETILPQKTRLYKKFGLVLSEDVAEKLLLQNAKKFGFRLYSIDQDSNIGMIKLFYEVNEGHNYENYVESEMGRNVFMATQIAAHLNSGDCKRVISVNGAAHINAEFLSSHSHRKLSTIPEILRLAAWESVAVRLRSKASSREQNLQAYDAIFYIKNITYGK